MILETVEGIRASFPQAAELIERLWAEVQRLSHRDYVPPVPMTEHDKSGPWLDKNEVEVEFFDTDGNSCGSGIVELELRLNDRGILIISKTRVGFVAQARVQLGGYRVWLGSDMVETTVAPVPLTAGDQYLLALNIPIRLGRDIGHNPDGRDDGPDRPNPPLPQPHKARAY